MDRNSLVGFFLLIVLLVAYVAYNQYSQQTYQKSRIADSIAQAKVHPKPQVVDSVQVPAMVPSADSQADASAGLVAREAEWVTLENESLSLVFSTKGAQAQKATLKEYKTSSGDSLVLFDGPENRLSAVLPIQNGALATEDLFYDYREEVGPDGEKTLHFRSEISDHQSVVISYTLPKEGYMVKARIHLQGMNANHLPLTWQTQALQTEKDIETERMNSQVYYRQMDKDHDYHTINNTGKFQVDKPVHWVGFRLQFFATALILESGFSEVRVNSTTQFDDSSIVARNQNLFSAPLTNNTLDLSWYVGPNHYQTLRSYHIGLDNMVPLGWGVMAFVKYINKWLIIPIFNVLSKFISNYGIIIMLMTIIIRLLLSFFTYKSYLSAAKMRVLKPEIDALREKYGDDQQKFGMEQMKLYRTAGVNPLGGCLPMLLQLPILFAMYYFFPTSIELRQEPFLWADDLSTYDSIARLPFTIPFYGNHVSLFTLLMTASSLFLALYNRNMTVQDPNNPMLKWMPYVFPFLLIGVFNKMAAALTFYYFFSNLISILQQFIIQKYIIDEDAIHRKMQENKNKPNTPSKWQMRLEEMQKKQMERAKVQPRKSKN